MCRKECSSRAEKCCIRTVNLSFTVSHPPSGAPRNISPLCVTMILRKVVDQPKPKFINHLKAGGKIVSQNSADNTPDNTKILNSPAQEGAGTDLS